LLIGYASVLALAAVLAVLSRTLMRPAVEPLHDELANTVPLLPEDAGHGLDDRRQVAA
jgi:hypothetical protein